MGDKSPEALDDFVQWVGNNKMAQGRDVREIKDIVSNPRAFAAFGAKGKDAALKMLNQDRPELSSPLFKFMIEMTTIIEVGGHNRAFEVGLNRPNDDVHILDNFRDSQNSLRSTRLIESLDGNPTASFQRRQMGSGRFSQHVRFRCLIASMAIITHRICVRRLKAPDIAAKTKRWRYRWHD